MNNILAEKETRLIEDILIKQLSVRRDQLTDDARIMEDLGADSLDVAEIVLALEEQLNLTIPDDCVEKVKTVRDIHETVAERSRKAQRP